MNLSRVQHSATCSKKNKDEQNIVYLQNGLKGK